MEKDIFYDNKEFQLERMILFSDAVFAIAITLLVIEIKVPEIEEYNVAALWRALSAHFFSSLFGFILSFAVIGQFWINHHRIFGHVHHYNTGLLWLNLHMLFWIVLVPFTSALNSRYGGMDLVWMIYSGNLTLIGLSLFFLVRYLGSSKRNLSDYAHNVLFLKYSKQRSLMVAIIFSMGIWLCLFKIKVLSWVARFVYLLIPLVILLINKQMKKAEAAAGQK